MLIICSPGSHDISMVMGNATFGWNILCRSTLPICVEQ